MLAAPVTVGNKHVKNVELFEIDEIRDTFEHYFECICIVIIKND